MVITTIAISDSLKKRLEKIKIHRREPYADVIKRLLDKEEKING